MKFIVLGYYRVGGEMLSNALNKHPEIKCICPHSSFYKFAELSNNQGFNTKYSDLEGLDLNELSQFKIIHLIRKDIIALTISNIINNKGQKAAHFYKGYTGAEQKFDITPEEIEGQGQIITNTVIEWIDKLKQAQIIFYEDMTNNQDVQQISETSSCRICDFLGIGRQILTTDLCKTNVFNLDEYRIKADWVNKYNKKMEELNA